MNQKTIRLLLVVFVILLIIAGYPWWKAKLRSETLPISQEFDFSRYTENAVESFAIKKDKDELKFIKEANGWLVNDTPATVSAITNFFAGLTQLKVGELVSKNPENHPNFGITDKGGYVLTLTQTGKTSSFIIGTTGSDFNTFYIKVTGAPTVYLVNSNFHDQLSLDLTHWQASPSATTSAQSKSP